MRLFMPFGWLLKKLLPEKIKAKLFDVAIDRMTKKPNPPRPTPPPLRTTVAPKRKDFLDHGPSSRRKP